MSVEAAFKKNADLGPRNLFHSYAAASNGINKSKRSSCSHERALILLQELCRTGTVAGLLGLVLLPSVQVFDTFGINANISDIALFKEAPSRGIKEMQRT